MKYILLFSAFLFVFKTKANYDVVIQVKDNQGRQARNLPVVLIENETKKARKAFTNSMGKATLNLSPGKWSINISSMKRCKFVEVPEFGNGSLDFMITYDPKHWARINRKPVNRSNISFKVENQSKLKQQDRPKPGYSYVEVNLKKLNKNPLSNFPVTLTCYKTKSQYIAQTNKQGKVLFEIPIDNDYEIDLEENESFSYIDLGKRSGFHKKRFTYQPLQIKEQNVNDTITQNIPADNEKLASSARSFLKLKVRNFKDDMADEDIYLKMLKSNKVYKAKVRKDGMALFMLPLHRQYMIETKYKKAIDVIDYMDNRIQTIGRSEESFQFNINYRMKYPQKYLPKNNDDIPIFSSEKFDLTSNSKAKQYFEKFMDKQYPEPTGKEEFGVYLKWATPEVNEYSKEAILEVGFKAKGIKALKNQTNRTKPIHLAFVIDVSGSMAGEERLEGVKRALKKLLKELHSNDIVSITTFNGSARVIITAKPMSKQKLIYEIIDDLQAGGGTSIYEGLQKGYPELEKSKIEGTTNRLVLLSDGYGSTPIEELISYSQAFNKKGFELSAIGVGSGYNQALLSQLATVGGGLMHFVGKSNNLDKAFTKELLSVTIPFAEDATIEVHYKDQLIWKQLYGHSATIEKGKASLELPNLYPGINKLMLVKFDLINPTKELEKSPVKVIMKYKGLATGKTEMVKKEERLKWKPADGKTNYLMEMNKKRIQAIATINQALKVMAQQHNLGNSKGAQTTLIKTKSQIQKIFPDASDKDIYELLTVLDNYILTFEYLFENQKKE